MKSDILFSRKPAALFAAAFAFCVFTLPSAPAQAQCEDPSSASSSMNTLVQNDIQVLNDFINQTWNFIDEDLTNTASTEVAQRMDEFDENVLEALNQWWSEYSVVMKEMTKQWSVIQVDQSVSMQAMMDAQSVEETKTTLEEREAQAQRRFRPSEGTCQLDSAGNGATKAQRMSRALAKGYATTDHARRSNKVGSISAKGKAAETTVLWNEYVADFCDPAKGDQGCTVAGTMAGKNTNLPALLFGDKQSIDISNANNRRLTEVAIRTLVTPESAEPVPAPAVKAAAGQEELLRRRSREARLNTVYHAVGQMVGERVGGGSGTDVSAMRTSAGINTTMTSTNGSYKEISDALGRARFQNPQYIARLIDDPAQIVRELGAVKAVQMQKMNDIYKRNEEMLYMEAANFATKLDDRVPSNAGGQTPVK